ncbi:MAG TPA: hypothetical protein VGQ91_02330, partial [Ideonella sp.]|nr:hypothetical protein [Ideonella sp.]
MTARQQLMLGACLGALAAGVVAALLPAGLGGLARAASVAAAALLGLAAMAWPLWRALGAEPPAVDGAADADADAPPAWLAVVADARVELDERGHVIDSASRGERSLFGSSPPTPGRLLWELPQLRLDPEAAERLRLAIEAQAAWPEMHVAWDDGR